MKIQRTLVAAAILATGSCAAFAQASIDQSGSSDTATIEQYSYGGTAPGFASISQTGGMANRATVTQSPSLASGTGGQVTVLQQGTFGNTANVSQVGTGAGATLQLQQIGGSNSQADLAQIDATGNSRIRAYQSAGSSTMLVQQQTGTANSYAAAEQVGLESKITVIQGQPGAPVASASARLFQYGDKNDGFTIQQGGSNLVSYTSQGSPQMVGYYYSPTTGWTEVDRTVMGGQATASTTTTMQSGDRNTAYILQYGSNHYAQVIQSGSDNLGGVLQSGNGNFGIVTQSGTGGNATVAQIGQGQSGYIHQSGLANTATIKQR